MVEAIACEADAIPHGHISPGYQSFNSAQSAQEFSGTNDHLILEGGFKNHSTFWESPVLSSRESVTLSMRAQRDDLGRRDI
jgi:hypothetical protein